MEPSWPRRIFIGAIILTAAFLAVRFAQKKSFNGDFAGAWSAAPGPGREAPAQEERQPGQPHLSAPERALAAQARVPQPSAMGGPTDFVDEAPVDAEASPGPAAEDLSEERYTGGSTAAGFGAGGMNQAPSVESAAAADGKIPGVRGQTPAPGAGKSPARAAGGSGKTSAWPTGRGQAPAGQSAGTESKISGPSRPETAAQRSRDWGRTSGDPSRAAPSASGDGSSIGTPTGSAARTGAPGAGPGRAVPMEVNSESAFESALASARGALSPASAPPPVSGRPVPVPAEASKTPARSEAAGSNEPLAGGLSISGGTEGPRRFATDRGKGAGVAVSRLPNGAIAFTADMDIVADGAGGHYKADQTGQAETALQYPGGGSLNPGELPFIVVPLDFHKTYPEVQLGDFAAVSYNGKTMFAIVGDKGPTGVVGEGSIHLAKSLGINANPNTGGVESGVQYVILPGTRGRIPRESAELQNQARELFRQRGLLP